MLTIPQDTTGDLINAAQVSGVETDPSESDNHASLLIPIRQALEWKFLPCIARQVKERVNFT